MKRSKGKFRSTLLGVGGYSAYKPGAYDEDEDERVAPEAEPEAEPASRGAERSAATTSKDADVKRSPPPPATKTTDAKRSPPPAAPRATEGKQTSPPAPAAKAVEAKQAPPAPAAKTAEAKQAPPPPPARAVEARQAPPPPAGKGQDAKAGAKPTAAPTAAWSVGSERAKQGRVAPAPVTGTMLTPEIRLDRHLGRSMSGVAWLVDHLPSGTKAELEFLDERIVGRAPDDLARFEQDIEAAARVQSEHLPRLLAHGVTREGMPYVVRELLEGERLGERIDRTGRLGLEQTRQLVVQLATTLARAHDQNVVHGDINPQRIWVCPSQRGLVVKLLDLGTAKPATLPRVAGLCSPGWLLGTPEFMSPELVHGTAPIDRRADLWALGVLAYVALTARAPFDGQTLAELFSRIGSSEPVPPSSIQPSLPEALDEWFALALHPDPTHRFTSAEELAFSFVEAASRPGETPVPGMVSALTPSDASERRRSDRPVVSRSSDRPDGRAQRVEAARPGHLATFEEGSREESAARSAPGRDRDRRALLGPWMSALVRSRAARIVAVIALAAIAIVLVLKIFGAPTGEPPRAGSARADSITAGPPSTTSVPAELSQAPDAAPPVATGLPAASASAPTAAEPSAESAPPPQSGPVGGQPTTQRTSTRTAPGPAKPAPSPTRTGSKKTPSSGLKKPAFD